VFGFGLINHILEATFLQITFRNEDVEVNSFSMKQESLSSFIEISIQHLIAIQRNRKQYRVSAGDVRVDDGQRVKAIHKVFRHGVYAPLTQSGDI
jgi:hypothetical protein